MLTWASVKNLKIANTMFRKQDHKLITHQSAQGQSSQMDYILVDKKTNSTLKDVETGNNIDLGSDHLCVKAIMKFEHKFQRKGRKKQRQAATAKALWPPESLEAYVEKLDELLEAVQLEEVAREKRTKRTPEAPLSTVTQMKRSPVAPVSSAKRSKCTRVAPLSLASSSSSGG